MFLLPELLRGTSESIYFLIVKISEVKIIYGPWSHNHGDGRSKDHRLPTGNNSYALCTGNLKSSVKSWENFPALTSVFFYREFDSLQIWIILNWLKLPNESMVFNKIRLKITLLVWG